MSDLSTITTEELCTELFNRLDHALLVYIDVKDFVRMQHIGGLVNSIGLAEFARKRLYEVLTKGE